MLPLPLRCVELRGRTGGWLMLPLPPRIVSEVLLRWRERAWALLLRPLELVSMQLFGQRRGCPHPCDVRSFFRHAGVLQGIPPQYDATVEQISSLIVWGPRRARGCFRQPLQAHKPICCACRHPHALCCSDSFIVACS
eukprot:350353-Chlamydomonas_euryale.AAC.7